jgi:RHS repeat-associated protein
MGRMVEKAVGTVYTQIVYSPLGAKYAVMNGQTFTKGFVPLPTGAKAVYTAAAGLAYYRHHDHLGSSRLATTPGRTLYSATSYAPFGEPYAEAGTTDRSFTGQDEDTVAGMQDFLDRRYRSNHGRWLTPDPIGLAAVNPASPQTWNRYAYVMNNPLALIDPFGDNCYDTMGYIADCNGLPDGSTIPNPTVQVTVDVHGGWQGCGSSGCNPGGINTPSPSEVGIHSGSFPGGLLGGPSGLPGKGFCTLTANVGNASQVSKNAISKSLITQAWVLISSMGAQICLFLMRLFHPGKWETTTVMDRHPG